MLYLKSHHVPKSARFTLRLSSRSFIVLCFAVWSLIHFELIFVMAVCLDSFFLFLPVSIQLFQHHLLQRLFFLHCIAFASLSKITFLYLCGSIAGSSCFIDLFIYPFANSS